METTTFICQKDRAKTLTDLMELNQFRDIYNDVTWTGANNKCKTTFYIPNMWILHRKSSNEIFYNCSTSTSPWQISGGKFLKNFPLHYWTM